MEDEASLEKLSFFSVATVTNFPMYLYCTVQFQNFENLANTMQPVVAISFARKANQRQVGIAVFKRNSERKLETQSKHFIDAIEFFEDNDYLSTLDAFLVQIGPCLLYVSEEYENASKGDGKKLANVLLGKEIETMFVKPSLFTNKKTLLQDLAKLTGSSSNHVINVIETERGIASGAIMCLLSTQRLVDEEDYLGNVQLLLGSVKNCMRLDSSAADAVNLLPKADHPSQYGSLYGVLNKCKTKMGSRLLERYRYIQCISQYMCTHISYQTCMRPQKFFGLYILFFFSMILDGCVSLCSI